MVQTISPDGTETRTVYDAMGRPEWEVDRYKPGSPDTGANGTHTFYDAQGQAYKTQRVANVVIAIENDSDPGVAGSGIQRSRLVSSGTVLSTTSSVFDALGQLSSQTGADGRTTRYTYFADGRQKTVTNAKNETTTYDHDRWNLDTPHRPGSSASRTASRPTPRSTWAAWPCSPRTTPVRYYNRRSG